MQIYVDDNIFGSTDEKLCNKFAKLVQSKYEMSMMGELTVKVIPQNQHIN